MTFRFDGHPKRFSRIKRLAARLRHFALSTAYLVR
jgi:hypothetical protein